MNKKQVQQRVLQNGKPLALNEFTWCERTRTFSSPENNLVLDFVGISDCTFKTGWNCTFRAGSNCTFKTGSNCTFKAGSRCIFDTGSDCTFNTGSDCTFNTESDCTFKTDSNCTFKTGWNCTFNTGSDCTFKTGWNCTFNTGSDCTFKTGSNCTFRAGSNCTFKAGSNCTFRAGWNCTFRAGSNCTFRAGSNCTFDTGSDCTFDTGKKAIIVRRDEFEVIVSNGDRIIQLCPYGIPGYLEGGMKDGKPHIIADGILSEIISQKGDVYKVRNHGEAETSYLVREGDTYSHGTTIKQAQEDLVYKLKANFEGDLPELATGKEWVSIYRTVTGACRYGVKSFVEETGKSLDDEYTAQEILKLVAGRYGEQQFREALAS